MTTKYIRQGRILRWKDSEGHLCSNHLDSISQAKRESRKLQLQGHKVRRWPTSKEDSATIDQLFRRFYG